MSSTRQVALIFDEGSIFDRKIIRGISTFVHEIGNWSLYLEKDPLQRLPDLGGWKGDGMIANLDDFKIAKKVSQLDIPIVGVGRGLSSNKQKIDIPYLSTDNDSIARLAAEHLIERGFKRLAYCGFPDEPARHWSTEREKAFESYSKKAGIPCSIFQVQILEARRWLAMQRRICDWLESLEKPVGLMTCDDKRARHVLEGCRTIGARVPEDIGVVGVDNDEMTCELTVPPLTSVEQGTRRLGYEAASMLNQLIHNKKISRPKRTITPEGVITRLSSDVLAIEDQNVADAVTFIRENLDRELQVSNVLEAVNLSRSALEPRFKSSLGRTIHAEILRLRINRAKKMLTTTDLSIKEIARKTSFTSAQYLTTVFRREVGQTPAELRRNTRF